MKSSYLFPLYLLIIFFQFCAVEKSKSSESNAALILLLTDPKKVKSSTGEDLVTTTSSGGIFTSIVNATSPSEWTYVDLKSGGIASTSTGNWDLRLKRFVIGTNSGSSGSGSGGSCFTGSTNFLSSFTNSSCTPTLDTVQSQSTGSGFGNSSDSASTSMFSWYNYDGTTHILSSKQEVYLIRGRDGSFYKLQILDFYSSAGTSGYLILKWAPL